MIKCVVAPLMSLTLAGAPAIVGAQIIEEQKASNQLPSIKPNSASPSNSIPPQRPNAEKSDDYSSATQVVTQLFRSIYSHNSLDYAKVAPKLILMAAPDFALPLTFLTSEKFFDGTKLISIGAAYRIKNPIKFLVAGDDAIIVPVILEHSGPTGNLRVTFDIQADSRGASVAYPGGLQRFLNSQHPTPQSPHD